MGLGIALVVVGLIVGLLFNPMVGIALVVIGLILLLVGV